jgi:thioesterase domain-containing protein
MSVHYLSELRMVQPHGPYFLAGYCFGGIVAFDMAQRLLAEGEDVATLVMFNSPSPSWLRRYGGIGGQPSRAASRPAQPPPRPFAHRVAGVVANPRKALHLLDHLRYRATLKIDPAMFALCARFDRPLPENKRDELFLRMNAILEKRYDEQPYPGEIVMFYGEGLYEDPELGWADAAAVVPHMVPGKHTRGNRESMAEPKVAFIAEHLQQHLADVKARLEGAQGQD